jgi:carnitine O-acetyltransferase
MVSGYAECKQALLDDFLKPGGDAERLQKLLLEHAARENAAGRSWLEQWWLKYAYNSFRDPLPLNINCKRFFCFSAPRFVCASRHADVHAGFMLIEDWSIQSRAAKMTQAKQAARLALSLMHWKRKIERGDIAPEFMKKKPVCMNQLVPIFSTTRNPKRDYDELVTVKADEFVIVLFRNHMFRVNCRDATGDLISVGEMEARLLALMQNERAPYGVGLFTGLGRTEWAELYEKLSTNERNRSNFRQIEQAAFMLVLDESSPESVDDAGLLTAAGDANNRYFDKVIQLIIFKNSRASINGEHTPFDALTAALMFADAVNSFLDPRVPGPPPNAPSEQPQLLQWDFAAADHAVADAQSKWNATVADVDFHVEDFREFGTNYMKLLKISPDVFLQMAIQLGYFKKHHTHTATYETGTTRPFFHGRTETVRTCSVEMVEWVRAMHARKLERPQLYALLKRASDAHLKYMEEATQGKGVDRHLLGLKLSCLESGQPLHPLFADPVVSESTTYRLSTSNIGGYQYIYGGFGKAVPDGYGVCYMPSQDNVYFTIVSGRACTSTGSHELGAAIRDAMLEMRELILLANPNAKL